MKILNPANGELIQELEEDSAQSITDKARRAAAARHSWARADLTARLLILKGFRDRLAERAEEVASLLTQEVGKPITQARNEIQGTLGRLDFFLSNTGRVIGEEVVFKDPKGDVEERITHEPLGVIANISAWNYPYFVGSNVFVPALLTGNTVLYKPSELSTLTGLKIADLLWDAGVPPDVFIPVVGGGRAGSTLLEQPLNGVFFTGSYATGRRIYEAAARQMIRVGLELGGKDPVYITDDVDVTAAAAAVADGAFYNTGQSCCSVERIYVNEKIYDAFMDEFLKTVDGMVVGDPTDEKTYIGPLTRAAQLQVLEEQVADAREKGAKLCRGGKRLDRPGNYFEPTVFTDTNHEMKLMRDESFGPIIGVQVVGGDEEALTLMNDTDYGLTAGVYSRDAVRARGILSRVNAGSVYWNCCDRVSPRLPWSGRNHSGIGSTLSHYGILTFVQPKAWHLRKK